MAEAASTKEEEFLSTNQTAFVVGHTGGTGLALVQELADRNIFQKVVLIGRRKLEKYDEEKYNKLEQKIVDFEKLEDYADEFKGHGVGFCCLGALRAKVGKEEWKKVDHDYIMKVAELAKAGGCRHFALVSSMGADSKSSFLQPRVKGEVEAECTDLGFQRLSIFRPGLLLAHRTDRRLAEGFFRGLLAPIVHFKPTLLSVPVETVAKAMVDCVMEPCQEPTEMFDNKSIHRLARGKGSEQ